MKKFSTCLKLFTLSMLLLSFASCQRSKDDFWEDAKTAQRHMGRGIKTLFGQSTDDSRELLSYNDFVGPSDYDFIPLNQADLKDDHTAAIPQSKESPGEPTSAIPSIDGFMSPSGQEADIFANINFRYNDYSVDYNRDRVKAIAAYMKKHPNLYIFVEGHCDERGSAAYNLSLGSRRSNSVRTMLIKEGVDLNRIFTVSYGKEKPLDTSNNESAWSKNRRAQFKLFYQ